MTGYSVRAVADAIMEFLSAHPACADTVEGVEQWWLRPRGLNPPRDLIMQALELLQTEGAIGSRRIGDRVLWRRPTPDDGESLPHNPSAKRP